MEPLQSMSPCDVIALGVAIALAICDDLSPSELNVLGNLISAIGSIISTWAAQRELLQEKCEDTVSLKDLQDQLQKLQDKYDALTKYTK